MNVWRFQERLTARLLAWAATSIMTGLLLTRRDDEFAKGVGEQFIGWGIINAAIAMFGRRSAQRRRDAPDSGSAQTISVERRNLLRLLRINTGLDVIYIAGGAWAAWTRGADDERWRGRGWGIIVQGAFLFVFDLIHAQRLAQPEVVDEPAPLQAETVVKPT